MKGWIGFIIGVFVGVNLAFMDADLCAKIGAVLEIALASTILASCLAAVITLFVRR